MARDKAQIELDLIEPFDTFKYKLMSEYLVFINDKLTKKLPQILDLSKQEIMKPFYSTQTYQELMTGGELAAEFGFLVGKEKTIVDGIIKAIGNDVIFKFKPFYLGKNARRVNGYLKMLIVESSFKTILNHPYARYYAGVEIKWLEWLLTTGTSIIIADYSEFLYQGQPGIRSRSGVSFMAKDTKGWGVDPAYAGTLQDNWITRTLNVFSKNILDAIEKIIEKEMSSP